MENRNSFKCERCHFKNFWRAYYIFKYPLVFHANLSNSRWDNVNFGTMRSVTVSDRSLMLRVGMLETYLKLGISNKLW